MHWHAQYPSMHPSMHHSVHHSVPSHNVAMYPFESELAFVLVPPCATRKEQQISRPPIRWHRRRARLLNARPGKTNPFVVSKHWPVLGAHDHCWPVWFQAPHAQTIVDLVWSHTKKTLRWLCRRECCALRWGVTQRWNRHATPSIDQCHCQHHRPLRSNVSTEPHPVMSFVRSLQGYTVPIAKQTFHFPWLP